MQINLKIKKKNQVVEFQKKIKKKEKNTDYKGWRRKTGRKKKIGK